IVLGRRGDRSLVVSQILDGKVVAATGDADGDGHPDLLAATYDASREAGSERQFILYRGTPSGFDPKPARSMTMDWDPSREYSVTGGGDLNGDGFADLAIGIVSAAELSGEVRVFLGSSRQTWSKPDWVQRDQVPGELFGDTVAFAGDVNRDGFGDLLVGAPHSTLPNGTQGRAYLFAGSKSGPSVNPVWTAGYPLRPRRDVDDRRAQFFGRYLSAAGDVNGDGFADVLIPAVFAGRNDRGEGLVFGYFGSSTGLSEQPDWIAEPNRPFAQFGWSAGSAGDVDRDGFGDVIVGARQFENGQPREGLVALYRGTPAGLEKSPVWVFESHRSVDETGTQVVGLGDLDGDGFVELAANSPGYHEPPGSEQGALGRVRVFFGSASGFAGDSGVRFEKPRLRWASEEWERLPTLFRWGIIVAVAAVIFGAGLWTREAWRRRTIVLVEKRERQSRLDERARIARDLHDEVGSRLSRFNVIVERVRTDAVDPQAVLQHSQNLSSTARDLRSAIEQMAISLAPSGDTVEGFLELVSRQTEEYFHGTNVRLRQDIPLDVPKRELPPAVRAELVPCIREALNNALRHSGAREVWLRAVARDGELTVEIEDNGRGFEPDRVPAGNGLRNLRGRMRDAGGRCHVRSVAGEGTVMTFTVPIGPERSNRRLPVPVS
ncbi:MAG: FG-GAP-like repeat-containing protein, partial [Limisphaerales bacterium]